MRIIGGKFKRRQIETITSNDVRPTTDRVRQTIFDVLNFRLDLEDAAVLDLFAGSGLLGFEAMSRDAASVTFIETHPEVIKKLNGATLLLNLEANADIVSIDAMTFIRQTTEQYDLIFADPPYRFAHYHELLETIFSRSLLKENGYLVLEHFEKILARPPSVFFLLALSRICLKVSRKYSMAVNSQHL
jgi:16S rRNA (guanine966-N2)-methyltransferase